MKDEDPPSAHLMKSTVMTDNKTSSLFDKFSDFFSHEPKTQDDLIEILKSAQERGLVDQDILSILLGAVYLGERQVREVMVPRNKMITVDLADKFEDILQTVRSSAHSRFPVINDNPDEVIGILLAKDLLPNVGQDKNIDIKELVRQASFVPESKRLHVLLKDFKANRNHMAVVIDEYGDIAGLVTIEDVLEQIVGNIEDEHDFEDELLIRNTKENIFVIKAQTPIEEFNDYFKTDFSDNEYDTIGGIVMQQFGHLPKRDESITFKEFTFRILNADHRSIQSIQAIRSFNKEAEEISLRHA